MRQHTLLSTSILTLASLSLLLITSAASAQPRAADRPDNRPTDCHDTLLDLVEVAKSDKAKFAPLKRNYSSLQSRFRTINSHERSKAALFGRAEKALEKRIERIEAYAASIAEYKSDLAAAQVELTSCAADVKCSKRPERAIISLGKRILSKEKRVAYEQSKIVQDQTKLDLRVKKFDDKVIGYKTLATGYCKNMAASLKFVPANPTPVATPVAPTPSPAPTAPPVPTTPPVPTATATPLPTAVPTMRPPFGPITYVPQIILSISATSAQAGQQITLTGTCSDRDGDMVEASFFALGVGDFKGNEFAGTVIGEPATALSSGHEAVATRTFVIPAGVTGTFWFRAEVFDAEGDGDLDWASIQVR